jgi:hypothetical protein
LRSALGFQNIACLCQNSRSEIAHAYLSVAHLIMV